MKTGVVKNAVIGNYWTTLWGTLAGVALYVQQNGVEPPTTKEEWKSFAVAMLLVFLGVAGKDSNVGARAS